jgi:hypothetical protein
MRFLGFGSLLLGVSVIVSACDRKPTPQEAELLLAKVYKNASQSFTCQDGERDFSLTGCTDSEASTCRFGTSLAPSRWAAFHSGCRERSAQPPGADEWCGAAS